MVVNSLMNPARVIGHTARPRSSGRQVQASTAAPRMARAGTSPSLSGVQSFSGFRRSNVVDSAHMSSRPDAGTAFRASVATSLASNHVSAGIGHKQTTVAVFERFTERAIKAVMLAQQEAKSFGCPEVGTEQLLLGLIAEDSTKGGFMKTGLTLEAAREAVTALGGRKGGEKATAEVPFSLGAKRVFEVALEESRRLGMNFIAPEHIAVALIAADDGSASAVLVKADVSKDAVKDEALKRLRGEQEKEGSRPMMGVGSSTEGEQSEGGGALEEFCRDLTAEARDNKTDPVIGRDLEVARVTQILARRSKNNPILLGEPGVGKTAIAEGLARNIILGGVPDFLKGKRVMSLDVGLLMAGAKERGELEQRVTNLLSECKEQGDVVLVVDEIHTLVGAGSVGRGGGGGGGLDISNLMKPALARGELQCIGATTLDEHRKYIEKDAALERRFQPVIVDEPTPEQSYEILAGLKDRYEKHHHCVYTDEAISACVSLSSRYIADRYLPDKAIDLMDEAGSRARITQHSVRKSRSMDAADMSLDQDVVEAEQLWDEMQQVQEAKVEAIKEGHFEEAALLKTREEELKDTYVGKNEANEGMLATVTIRDIERVASLWSGVPVEAMSDDDQEKLLHLDDTLEEHVIGQTDAVKAIARAMQRSRVGLKDPDRPIASMLFSGPTGVGKTELTKSLAKHYFGSEDAMVRLDMSEYMERHSVSKLVGSPPGYVGFGEGGTLTEDVRRRPFTVVLLDEVEKAHPDVFNLLLQVLEDGRLTDSQGRVVSFKNTLIIMTSNIGSQVIAKGGGGFGFELPTEDSADDAKYGRIRSLVLEELKAYFKPELLNRLDEVVVFRQLAKDDVRAIADIMLAETAERMAINMGIFLEVTAPMMSRICEEGYDQAYGARPLRRAIMRLVDDTLSEAVLQGDLAAGDVARLDIDVNGDICVVACRPGEPCDTVCISETPEIVFETPEQMRAEAEGKTAFL